MVCGHLLGLAPAFLSSLDLLGLPLPHRVVATVACALSSKHTRPHSAPGHFSPALCPDPPDPTSPPFSRVTLSYLSFRSPNQCHFLQEAGHESPTAQSPTRFSFPALPHNDSLTGVLCAGRVKRDLAPGPCLSALSGPGPAHPPQGFNSATR